MNLKPIPRPTGLDNALTRVLEPMIHAIEKRLLQRSGRDRCPTIEELINAGVITSEQAEKF